VKFQKIQKAKAEIARLQEAIKALEDEATNASDPRNGYYYGYPKLTGAVRRASIDVTRALADLRKHD
jgi:aromatic ring hydroxylase